MIDIEKTNWTQYLARPFDLFGASVWNEWYVTQPCEEAFGARFDKGLFIESPRGMVRHYREENQLKHFFATIQESGRDIERARVLLCQGLELNNTAVQMLEGGTEKSLEEAVDFLSRLALTATIFPYLAGDVLIENATQDQEIIEMTEKLRGGSLYPRIMQEIITPLAIAKLSSMGVPKEALSVITFREMCAGVILDYAGRLHASAEGKHFIYQYDQGVESIEWHVEVAEIIGKIEHTVSTDVVGRSAYPGIVRGRARLVFTNNPEGVLFDEGDVLVATSTNPNILPLMQKAVAFVTDEGGITCHAAIISRELRKPCVVGTKVATQLIKDGDLIEVDAGKGVVKILS